MCGEGGFSRKHGASSYARNGFISAKTKQYGIAQHADFGWALRVWDHVGAVFDQQNILFVTESAEFRNRTRNTKRVLHNDGTGAWRDGLAYSVYAQVQGTPLNIDIHRLHACGVNGIGKHNTRVTLENHFVGTRFLHISEQCQESLTTRREEGDFGIEFFFKSPAESLRCFAFFVLPGLVRKPQRQHALTTVS